MNERDSIADFGFNVSTIAVFFDGAATVNASGSLELAEGGAESFVAAAENPINNFAFAHGVEIIDG